MLTVIISFIAMLNPFALFLYLEPIMDDLTNKSFTKVLTKATMISAIVLALFVLSGDHIFRNVFHINFESFRIFGGIIIFTFAFQFIIKGHRAFITMTANLDDLASEIALPFMVGSGTISLSILMRNTLDLPGAMIALVISLTINFIIIIILKALKDHIARKKFKVLFDKIMEISLRINGFFLGAIGIDMIITGLKATILRIS